MLTCCSPSVRISGAVEHLRRDMLSRTKESFWFSQPCWGVSPLTRAAGSPADSSLSPVPRSGPAPAHQVPGLFLVTAWDLLLNGILGTLPQVSLANTHPVQVHPGPLWLHPGPGRESQISCFQMSSKRVTTLLLLWVQMS